MAVDLLLVAEKRKDEGLLTLHRFSFAVIDDEARTASGGAYLCAECDLLVRTFSALSDTYPEPQVGSP